MRQLDRVSRELLARAWDVFEDSPLTIDIDSTVCETYGLAKEGARHHNYTGQRGLSSAAGRCRRNRRRADGTTAQGPSQHRPGRANFLRETVARVRHAGATGALTVRADSGFYAHTIVAVCRKMDVIVHPTAPPTAQSHEAIPETDWTPIPYWMDGAADVADDSQPDAAPVRLIVRRVKPTPGSQLAFFTNYSYHGFTRTERATPSNWKPTTADTPRWRTPSAT